MNSSGKKRKVGVGGLYFLAVTTYVTHFKSLHPGEVQKREKRAEIFFNLKTEGVDV